MATKDEKEKQRRRVDAMIRRGELDFVSAAPAGPPKRRQTKRAPSEHIATFETRWPELYRAWLDFKSNDLPAVYHVHQGEVAGDWLVRCEDKYGHMLPAGKIMFREQPPTNRILLEVAFETDENTPSWRQTRELAHSFVDWAAARRGIAVTNVPAAIHPVPAQLTASKRSPKKRRGRGVMTESEKIQAVRDWDVLKEAGNAPLLAKWLEDRFGLAEAGLLKVPESTFYGWRRLVPKS